MAAPPAKRLKSWREANRLKDEAISKTITIEAMKAYASWSEALPRDSQSVSTPFKSLFEVFQEHNRDLMTNRQWLTTYMTDMKANQWWTIKSEAEIFELLDILPLNKESFEELKELVKMLRMMSK